jgi:hypothetical protein
MRFFAGNQRLFSLEILIQPIFPLADALFRKAMKRTIKTGSEEELANINKFPFLSFFMIVWRDYTHVFLSLSPSPCPLLSPLRKSILGQSSTTQRTAVAKPYGNQ